MSSRTFVIGDVHGCSATLKELLDSICGININDKLIFVGDLIDKGPDSKAVLDYVLKLKELNYEITYIRGNHEQMMLNSLDNAKAMKDWFRNGGKNTLDNFDVYHPGFIEDKYIDFILSSKYYCLMDKFVVTHAGLNFNIDNPFNDTAKMLSARGDYCDSEKIGNRKLIVGHTPTSLDKIKSSIYHSLIKIDGGCVYHKQVQGLGYLVALELESLELFHLQNIEE